MRISRAHSRNVSTSTSLRRRLVHAPFYLFFFFIAPAPPEISPLPHHAPLPIWVEATRHPQPGPRLCVAHGQMGELAGAGSSHVRNHHSILARLCSAHVCDS